MFCTIRGEQREQRWTDATWCIFCVYVAYLLASEWIFFNLGINNKFVIVNSFSCIFTSYRAINCDVLILQTFSEDTFYAWTWRLVTRWCLLNVVQVLTINVFLSTSAGQGKASIPHCRECIFQFFQLKMHWKENFFMYQFQL